MSLPLNINTAARRFLSKQLPSPDSRKLDLIRAGPSRSEVSKLESLPKQLQTTRTCTIYRPSKPATQSGRHQTRQVRLEFDKQSPKWESRVLGWTSSEDSVQGLVMSFEGLEAAVRYCEEQGIGYSVRDVVEEEEAKTIKPKGYAENFKYCPGTLKMIHTK
jgi:NADH dehydrogenase (ubiquinone) Fe-S protein 4